MRARAGATARHTFRALAVRNYRLYFTGQLVSVSGTWMQTIALTWLVLQLGGSGLMLGLTLATQYLPLLLLGPLAGVAVDRFDKRRTLFLTQSIAASMALIIGVLTATGLVIGTPNWMSPEQALGKAATPATDVWAIGLVAFYMLTGRPFWRASVRPDDRRGVMKEIALEPIPIASTRALELGIESALPAGFDPWFAQCVARPPEDRFHTATAAYKALAQTLGPPQ
jgi:serine/threonine protein kinase